ncbi:FHA domain-containing protein [Agaribacter marinus]|uniref:FHA domain-containing protein n=1 Tax=Agaribacter marinus TaxID=1431249 RepID=A0AA37WJG9_9ALTE|nr:FHA domain-containing protein [Agaribacter marinus]GLR69740.1 hypothetical protein GCM10007852_06480 [Agaribacter marinus]
MRAKNNNNAWQNVAVPYFELIALLVFFVMLLLNANSKAYAKGDHVVVMPSSKDSEMLPEYMLDSITYRIEEQLTRRLHHPLQYQLKNTYATHNNTSADSVTNDMNEAPIFDAVLSNFPETDALLQYSILKANTAKFVLEVFDPYSQTLMFSVSLPFDNSDEVNKVFGDNDKASSVDDDVSESVTRQLLRLASQAGGIAAERLDTTSTSVTLRLSLSGFKVDELVPVTTYLLSLSPNNKITLLDTVQLPSFFSRFLPIVSTRYAVTSDMSVSQLHNELVRFWQLQDVSVDIAFSRDTRELTLNRVNNPYTPSVVSTSLVVFGLLIIIHLFIRRYYFHHQLEMLAQGKRADEWLNTYERANKPWLRLEERWKNQLNYWQQIKRESAQLEKQAKTCFDAGDTNSSKIFISKALNINANAPLALKLMHAVESFEENAKQLTEQEQWIRNKVAKAMSNYRNNQPYKALRQAYQAEQSAKEQKHLKKQLKAIRKLINRINNELSPDVDRIKIVQTALPHELNFGIESTLLIGRNDADFVPLDNDSGLVSINHKGLSRIGRHLKISVKNDGFFIQDVASTNGVFVDGERLKPGEERLLENNNGIMLGAESSIAAVGFSVKIGENNHLLQLIADDELQKKMPISELSRIWPDYIHAMRVDIGLASGPSYLYIHKHTGKLALFDSALKQSGQNLKYETEVCETNALNPEDYQALVKLELGTFSTISPIDIKDDSEQLAKVVEINGHKLLGKMPLLLPLDIRWEDVIISMKVNPSTFMSDLDVTSTRMLRVR